LLPTKGQIMRLLRITRPTARIGAGAIAAGLMMTFLPVATARAGIDNPDGSKVDTFDSMALILPLATDRGASAVRLEAARNEYESFQVKVSAGATALASVSVSLAAALKGPGLATIPAKNVRFLREDYYTLTTMSDGELATEFPRDAAGTCQGDCRIPDALIPERDIFTNEDRAAFPANVPANENRVAWVDVLVPPTAQGGIYSGSVVVKNGASVLANVPLTVEVLNVTLPSTATMKSQVFVNANDIGGSWATYQQLAELGLNNRLSVVPDGFDPTAGSAILDQLLGGTDPKVPLTGARLTQLPFTRWADPAKWRAALTQLGRVDAARFWCDEVDTATCGGWYSTALAAYPGLKLQQIPKYQKPATDPDALDPRTQTAVPITTGLDSRLTGYQQWKTGGTGRELWSYTGCMQGGCNAPYLDNALYDGTAGFGIDQPTSQARAMGWHGFRANLDGEHYWTAAGAYARSWNACVGTNPTNCQYTAAGEATGMNGDGNLFYAWNPAKIGGTTPIPAESIRLKRFRDGREDNDLMQLLAAHGKAADAQAIAAGLFPRFDQSTRTPAQVAAARHQLDDLVRTVFPTPPVNPQDLNCDGESDMLAVGSDGQLRFYARHNGDWDPTAPKIVATGWLNRYVQLLLPGDINGDGRPDLLGRTTANTFELWKGNCAGGFTQGAALPATFKLEDPSTPGDFDGDGRPDLLNRKADGTLWLASGNGAGRFTNLRQIGAGWNDFTIVGAGDANRDGKNDVFGRRSDGRVFLYRGNGAGGWLTGNGEDSNLVLPPAGFPRLLGPGDVTADGKVDMVVVDSGGRLLTYAGDGAGGWAGTAAVIGSGWNTVIAQIAD
jgi:hypothetical protein